MVSFTKRDLLVGAVFVLFIAYNYVINTVLKCEMSSDCGHMPYPIFQSFVDSVRFPRHTRWALQ